MNPSKQVEGGHAVVIIPYSIYNVLLVKNLLNPRPLWKLIAETGEPGEPILNAVAGGLREEAGFMALPVQMEHGEIVKIGDKNLVLKEVRAPRRIPGRGGEHWQHFYKIRMPDEVLMSLSGQTLDADIDERMETRAFPILDPEGMTNFLPQHKLLFQEFLLSP